MYSLTNSYFSTLIFSSWPASALPTLKTSCSVDKTYVFAYLCTRLLFCKPLFLRNCWWDVNIFKKSSNSALEINISIEKPDLPNKLNPKFKDSGKKKEVSLTPTGIYKINNVVCSSLGSKPTGFKIIKCYHQRRIMQVPNKVVWDTKSLPIYKVLKTWRTWKMWNPRSICDILILTKGRLS